MRARSIGLLLLLVVVLSVGAAYYFLDPDAQWKGSLRGEPFFAERAASAWHAVLSADDENSRALAAEKLKDGKADALPVLTWLLRSTGPAEPRWRAADALGQIGVAARPTGPDLIAALKDSDPHVRSVAAKSLGELAPDVPGAVEALIELFPDPQVIRVVARFRQSGAPAVPRLIELLTHPDVTVRWNAARTLGKIGEPSMPAVPAILKHMTDPDPIIREHAAEALGDIGPAAAATIPELVKLLSDPEWKVRRDAVRALGQMGAAAKPVLAQVQALKSDPNDEVKAYATKAEALIDPSLDKRTEGRGK